MGDDDREPRTHLVQHMRLQWGVRCIFRRTSFLMTTGPHALALCAAVTGALERPTWSPDLAVAARTWRLGVAPADAAAGLRYLAETVTQVVTAEFGEIPAPGLDTVLEQLMGEAKSASSRSELASYDVDSGCPNRRALEGDLADSVAEALADGGDVALAVVELHPSVKRRDEGLLSLVAVLRRALGAPGHVYRVAATKLAVLLPGQDSADAGTMMLRATCGGAPRFMWGASSLQASGVTSAERADAVVLLAEADLHLRSRDYTHARKMLTRQRRHSALAAVAGALVMVAGVTLGLSSTGPSHLHGPAALRSPVVGPVPPAPQSTTPPLPGSPPPAVPTPGNLAGLSAAPTVRQPLATVVHLTPTPGPAPATGPPAQSSQPPAPAPSPPPGTAPPTAPSSPVSQLLGEAEGLVNSLLSSLNIV